QYATARCRPEAEADNRVVAEGEDGYFSGTTGLPVGLHPLVPILHANTFKKGQMMEEVGTLKVGIVGGGSGCKAIMDMIFAERLSQLRMSLIGVACTNPEAVGYQYALEKGVYTTDDFLDLYELPGLNIIVELTGNGDVANQICQTKPDHVRVIDHVAARLFWDIFRIEEERIAERQRVEERAFRI
ncbi:MAG: hypothetical protein JRJ17_06050, partial [Deltaproteobacteria bacterium]|nr:hypothetical protein [Deltaproteobacteria bacterium]